MFTDNTYRAVYILLLVGLITTLLIYCQKNDKIEGLNTFTGRMAVDDQYFYDKLFDNVTYYPNRENGVTGWVDCKLNCLPPRHCVEYGVHGHSYCI